MDQRKANGSEANRLASNRHPDTVAHRGCLGHIDLEQ